jgi:hypothetical protein
MPVDEAPIDLARQPHQRMLQVDDPIQRRPEKVLLTLLGRLAHRPSLQPEDRPSESRSVADENQNRKEPAAEHRFLAIPITSNPMRPAQAQRLLNSSGATRKQVGRPFAAQ